MVTVILVRPHEDRIASLSSGLMVGTWITSQAIPCLNNCPDASKALPVIDPVEMIVTMALSSCRTK